jgi:hypothetical protein
MFAIEVVLCNNDKKNTDATTTTQVCVACEEDYDKKDDKILLSISPFESHSPPCGANGVDWKLLPLQQLLIPLWQDGWIHSKSEMLLR